MSEIRALAQVLGDKRQGTIESVYGPDFFVEEMAELSRQIDRPFTWVAIVTQKSNASYAPDLVARVHKSGGRVYPQVSCKPIVVQMQLCDPFPLANVPAFNEILELPSDARAARLAQPEWRKRASVEVRDSINTSGLAGNGSVSITTDTLTRTSAPTSSRCAWTGPTLCRSTMSIPRSCTRSRAPTCKT